MTRFRLRFVVPLLLVMSVFVGGQGLVAAPVAWSQGSTRALNGVAGRGADCLAVPAVLVTYAWNADDQYVGETLVGGSRAWAYTNGRVTNYTETISGVSSATVVGYDSTGRVKTESTGGLTRTFGYDVADQLKTVTPSTGDVTTYSYDLLGRRTSVQVGALVTSNSFDAASQLLSAGSMSFSYDLAGRRVSETDGAGVTSYSYDAQGRLASTVRGATTVVRGYDPDDNLVTVTKAAAVTTLDWDPTSGLTQPTLIGGQRLVAGPAGWVQARVGVTENNVGRDLYGSVTSPSAVARGSGYDVFGVATGVNSWMPLLGYRGEVVIDSLAYLRARNYDTVNGVFTTRDPLDGVNGTTVVANPYHYANNNPIMNTDPTGMSTVTDGLYNARQPALTVLDICSNYHSAVDVMDCFGTIRSRQAGSLGQPLSAEMNDYLDYLVGYTSGFPEQSFFELPNSPCASKDACVRAISAVRQGWPMDAIRLTASIRCVDEAADCALSEDVDREIAQTWEMFGMLGYPSFVSSLPVATNTVDDVVGAVCSFSGETRVLMADGTTKPISEIEVGDEVLAYDPETGERGPREVTHLWVHRDTLVDLEVGESPITTTEDHPFWNVTDRAWQPAVELDTGDLVLTAGGGTLRVDGLDWSTTSVGTAYNLSVDGIHTYFVQVGSEEILVHNTCPGVGGLAGEFDADELAQLTYQHVGAGDIAGRPSLLEIETAISRATPVRLPGQNAVQFEYNGVRVIINEDIPTRSTAYYPGG